MENVAANNKFMLTVFKFPPYYPKVQ
jgi:hypothetical protein